MGLQAGWYAQDDGRERYWDGEKWTDAFRGSGVDPAPAADAPDEPAKKSGSGIGCLASILALVALVIVFSLQSCGDDSSDSTDKYAVQATCKDLVKNNLKNPSTADFSNEQQTSFSASGQVAAQNALGGTVTYSYSCTATGDTVTFEGLTER